MNEFMLIGDLIGKNIISDAIRSIAAFIDAIWLSVISLVYNLIFAVANFSSSEGLQNLYNLIESRVYVIVGIFMLFKVLMSLISYLANPDKLTDKEQGAGKLITRIITSVLMLIAVPQILFPMLDRLQEPLVRTVAKVVMGNEVNTSDASFGDSMALSLFSAFFFPNEDCTGDGTYEWNTENPRENSVFSDMGDLPTLATEACSDGNKKIYRYDYFMFLSTIISTIVIIVLLLMGIDIAVRSFKLVVLKALAPIPILSYISPKSAKDGIFSSYVKLFATTWLDLFIKFGVIYLGFAFIQLILNGDLSVGLTSALLGSGFGMVFLILGAIIFMFQAPKFIKKALNLKDGEFGTGIAGLLGMGAATAGMIGSGVSGYKASLAADDANHREHNVFRNVGAGLAGALGGGAAGAKVAMGKDASIGKVMEALNKKNAQTLAMGAAGSTFGGRVGSSLQSFFTGQNAADMGKKKIDDLEAFNKSLDAVGNRVKGEMVKSDKTSGEFIKNSGLMFNYKEFMAAKNAAASTGATSFKVMNRRTGNYESVSMQAAEMYGGYLQKTNEDDYIKQTLLSDGEFDQTLSAQIADAQAKAVSVTDESVTRDYFANGTFTVSGRDSVKKTQDAITRDVLSEKRANAKAEADARFSHKK